MNFGLERIHNLLEALNRPDERTKIVHVAGTNGKGSVCAYIASVIRACNHTVGRFNSPHLIEPRDSININGKAISQEKYDEAFSHVAHLNSSKAIGATSFECLVGAAFYAFDEAKLEFVVLEVGLGGLLDATNVICCPVMTIITAIGMDHANILGNTLEEIATAKAGIMKPNCPVVIAPQDSEQILDVLVKHAIKTESPHVLVQPSTFVSSGICRLDINQTCYEYPIQLYGDYQRMNSATAVTALDWLCHLNLIDLTSEKLAQGMRDTRWPGRLDWITAEENPVIQNQFGLSRILVDGAHNPQATIALRKYIDSLNKKKVIWIIGSTMGKDIQDMLTELIRANDIVIAVPFTQPAGMPWIQSMEPNEITKRVSDTETIAYDKLEEALKRAGKIHEQEDVVVLCGSLYLVADLYRSLTI